jgi:hypothetical protein
MNEEASLADEVVMVIGDSEIVDRFLAGDGRESRDAPPIAVFSFESVTELKLARFNPFSLLSVSASGPERMSDAWAGGPGLGALIYHRSSVPQVWIFRPGRPLLSTHVLLRLPPIRQPVPAPERGPFRFDHYGSRSSRRVVPVA